MEVQLALKHEEWNQQGKFSYLWFNYSLPDQDAGNITELKTKVLSLGISENLLSSDTLLHWDGKNISSEEIIFISTVGHTFPQWKCHC